MRLTTRWGSALGGLALLGGTTAWALEAPAPVSAPPSPVRNVQFDGAGPGMQGGGPGYGGAGGLGQGGGGRRFTDPVGPHHYVPYHGFRIDIGAVEGAMDPANATASVEHQIDMVEQAGLSPSMMSLFRTMSIRVSASFAEGSHYTGGPQVVIGGSSPQDNRPVLLHEFMHVLHDKRLPGGYGNPTIEHFYEEAVSRGLYEQGSYMLSNRGEFFAMTASCFLHGTVARAPYTRDAIRQAQPDYYAYLTQLFGRGGVAGVVPADRDDATVH